MITPIYTNENCRFAYQLQWSLSVFWLHDMPHEEWLPGLAEQTERDGVRLLSHRFARDRHSLFLVSTKPQVTPSAIARAVKGRLQRRLAASHPKAFQRNYAIKSVGSTKAARLDGYLATQLAHHPLVDRNVEERFRDYQIHDPAVDLAAIRFGDHAPYAYNLHLSFVHAERWRQIDGDALRRVRERILFASLKKKHLLSRAAILPDHLHMSLGCRLTESPAEVALSYMNNLAHVQGMRPIYQFSAFIGTFGEYDLGAMHDSP